jgi:hypothetical protein
MLAASAGPKGSPATIFAAASAREHAAPSAHSSPSLSHDLLAVERHSLRPQPLLARELLYLFCCTQSEFLFQQAKTSMADENRGLRFVFLSSFLCRPHLCLSAKTEKKFFF